MPEIYSGLLPSFEVDLLRYFQKEYSADNALGAIALAFLFCLRLRRTFVRKPLRQSLWRIATINLAQLLLGDSLIV